MAYHRDRGDGRFLLYDTENPDKILFSTDGPQLAMIADVADGVLHKHGNPESLAKKHVDMVNRMRVSVPEWAENLRLINVSHWPLDVINRCISTSGYVKLAYEMYGSTNEVIDINATSEPVVRSQMRV